MIDVGRECWMVSWLSCGEAIAIFNNNAKNRKVKIKKKKKSHRLGAVQQWRLSCSNSFWQLFSLFCWWHNLTPSLAPSGMLLQPCMWQLTHPPSRKVSHREQSSASSQDALPGWWARRGCVRRWEGGGKQKKNKKLQEQTGRPLGANCYSSHCSRTASSQTPRFCFHTVLKAGLVRDYLSLNLLRK